MDLLRIRRWEFDVVSDVRLEPELVTGLLQRASQPGSGGTIADAQPYCDLSGRQVFDEREHQQCAVLRVEAAEHTVEGGVSLLFAVGSRSSALLGDDQVALLCGAAATAGGGLEGEQHSGPRGALEVLSEQVVHAALGDLAQPRRERGRCPEVHLLDAAVGSEPHLLHHVLDLDDLAQGRLEVVGDLGGHGFAKFLHQLLEPLEIAGADRRENRYQGVGHGEHSPKREGARRRARIPDFLSTRLQAIGPRR